MTDQEKLLRSSFCCSCDQPLSDSTYINLVDMHLQATWEFPTSGNVLTGRKGSAVAVVCDTCIDQQKEITKVIERRGDAFVYHAAKDLKAQWDETTHCDRCKGEGSHGMLTPLGTSHIRVECQTCNGTGRLAT